MRRLLVLVSAVVLVDTAFYAAITPLLPHYSDELGLSKTAAGVLTGAYAAGTLVGALPGGWLAARWGVKQTLLLGLGLLSVTSVVFAFADDLVLLDVSRFVQGLGGACSWAAGMAWLVAGSPRERRGALIGSALGAAVIGVLLGPVLGGAATIAGPEPVFSLIGVVGIGLAAWAWSMPGPRSAEGTGAGVLAALRDRGLIWGFWLFMLPALFSGVVDVLVPLRLDEVGASGAAVGAAFLVAAAVEATVSPIAGRVSDRRGRLFPIRAGLAGAAVTAILLPLPGTAVLVALALLAAIAALGTFWAPAMALVSDVSETAGLDQGIAFAISNLAWSSGILLGSAAGGALADSTSDAVPYGLLAAACAATLIGVSSLGASRRDRSAATA